MSPRLFASLLSRRKPSLRLALITWVAAAALAGCGGGGGGDGSAGTPPVVPAPPVDGPAWFGFGRDAQHSANSAIATQDLNRIAWSTPLDLAPTYTAGGALLVHYGSPVVTSRNTIVLPVKTGAAGGFRVEARSGGNGGLIETSGKKYLYVDAAPSAAGPAGQRGVWLIDPYDVTIKDGEPLFLRYLVVAWDGETPREKLNDLAKSWAK